MGDDEHFPFERLDFVYMPSTDVASDVEYFIRVLGARLEFAIEAFETRVAMVRLSEAPPSLLFAGHRVAIYELTRPEAAERLAGRRDF